MMLSRQFGADIADDVSLQGDQIFTTDLLIEGTHFNLDYFSLEDLGWKAVAVNASDIAATGGILDGILVSLGLPATVDRAEVAQFYQGLYTCLTACGGRLWGGDTARAPQWTVNITAVGHMPAGYTPGRRFNAQAGDLVITTGSHGLSAVGLQVLQAGKSSTIYPNSCEKHRRPVARLEAGQQLSSTLQRYALMDSSDGLADAALKLAQASQVGMVLTTVDLHPEVLAWAEMTQQDPVRLALYGGEDFELLACVPQDTELTGWRKIGMVTSEHPGEVWLQLSPEQRPVPLSLKQTYQHFV